MNGQMSGETPASPNVRFDLVSRVWRALVAPHTLIGLMGVLALILGLSALIPQIPPQTMDDPRKWLAAQPDILNQTSGLVRALGLFRIYHSLWFHLILALIGLTLFVQGIEAAELAWRFTGRTQSNSPTGFWWEKPRSALRFSSALGCDEVVGKLYGLLSQYGYRWTQRAAPPALDLLATRRRHMLWTRPVAHGALLLTLIGLFITETWGWHSGEWLAAPGDRLTIGHGTPYSVQLDTFARPTATAPWCDSQSIISWREGETVTGQSTIGMGQPATWRGITVRQLGQLPVVRLRGLDPTGNPLAFQVGGTDQAADHEAEIAFSLNENQQVAYLPSDNLLLSFVYSPDPGGRLALYVSHPDQPDSQPRFVTVLQQDSRVAVDDLQLEVGMSYRPVLRVDSLPGMELAIGGAIVAVLALALGWIAPAQILWSSVVANPDGSTTVQIFTLPGASGSRWLLPITRQFQEAQVQGE